VSTPEMDSPLWRFSLAVYRGAGVPDECLAVQERFGVVSTGPNGPDISLRIDGMIKTADECLFRAKAGGRDRACGHEIETALGLVAHG